jgi:large subunit ribosomal protein L7/L12
MATQTEVVDFIKNLKLSEVQNLIKTLEDELGVEASAPVMMGGMMPAGGAAAEAAEEQTEFDVVLKEVGDKKLAVIKAVRALTQLGLKDAKAVVDGCPSNVRESVDKETAEAAKADLEAAGATVELK